MAVGGRIASAEGRLTLIIVSYLTEIGQASVNKWAKLMESLIVYVSSAIKDVAACFDSSERAPRLTPQP